MGIQAWEICRLRWRTSGLSSGMHFRLANWIRPGIVVLICAVLAGCAVDMGPYPRTQSIEAAVQTVLAKQGYYQGPIDGTIGPATSRAIRNYQRDHRLTPTGTINPALAASMGLAAQGNAYYPYYAGYASYYPWYSAPAFFAPPAVINLGWGGWWPSAGYGGCWNRGWGGYGYRGWGGCGNRGWRSGGWRGGGGRGWCR